jgi:phosphoesterase RecJ-like protein
VPDAAVVVDCSDLFRTGKVGGYISKSGLVINIDHHISNSRFGGINWVEHNVSSTCEMLYKICTQLKVLDEKIALCLYTGMFTDTGSFSFSNATGRTHAIISKLLDFDIAPQKVYQAVYSVYAPEDIRLVGRLITRVRQDRNGQVAWLSVADWPKEPKVDLTETIFSVMRLIKGPGVLVLFKRVGRNRVRVNFRSRGNFDVNKAAKAFGGGGHATASGTTVQGSLPVVEKDVIGYIRKRMPACRQAGSNG